MKKNSFMLGLFAVCLFLTFVNAGPGPDCKPPVVGGGGGGGSAPFSDATAIVKNAGDATKLVKIDATNLPTGSTLTLDAGSQAGDVTLSVPGLVANDTIATLGTANFYSDTQTVQPNVNSHRGVVVKAHSSSQTGDMIQLLDSTGAQIGHWNPYNANPFQVLKSDTTNLFNIASTGFGSFSYTLTCNSGNDANQCLVAKGNSPTQTANYIELQKNDGTVIGGLNTDGGGLVVQQGTSAGTYLINACGTNHHGTIVTDSGFYPYSYPAGGDLFIPLGRAGNQAWAGCYLKGGLYFQTGFGAAATLAIDRATASVAKFTDGSTNGGTFSAIANSPAQITANTDDYNPGGTSYVQRWNSDASRNVTGLTFTASQVDGQTHLIVNTGSQNIVLKHQTTSTAANRFLNSTGADITLSPNQAADVTYDATQSRWLVFKRN